MKMAGSLRPHAAGRNSAHSVPAWDGDCALLHSFLLSPPEPLRLGSGGAPVFLLEENEKMGVNAQRAS
nr:hypothetical protein [uncultured Oscillibacter sp.]